MTNEEKIESMLKFFHGSRTLKDLLLEMAEWKDSEFEKRVTLALCIDCCEYESCEKCHKYNLKKELLGL